MAQEDTFRKVIKTSAALPFVKVDRAAFLQKELKPYCSEVTISSIVERGNGMPVDKKVIDKIARGCINYHTTVVTGTSALAGIPGGWFMAGTIPADVAQFYGHVMSLTQKLMYLYGWPDITNDAGEIDDDTCSVLILFIGLMMGETVATNGINALLKELGGQVVKKLPKKALTKVGIYNLAKQLCKWIGIKLTKEGFAKFAGKAIPLIGAPVSAALTYATFKPMATKLKKKMDEQWQMSH